MRGFGLWEVLIALGMLIAVSLIILPSYFGFADTSSLASAVDIVVQALNKAQSFARAGKYDSAWGVKVNQGEVILFKGESFTSFDPTTDEKFLIPRSISVSGVREIVFEKLTGLPLQTGEMVLNSRFDIKTITINAQGTLEY